MAWQLYTEVLHHAPADLTSGELVVLLVLADAVRQGDRKSRRCSLDRAELARLARMEPVGINRALQRLATKRGLEVRVPLTTGKDDRPVYAVHGRRCVYQIPQFVAPLGCTCASCKPSEGEPTGDPSAATASRVDLPKGDPQVTLSQTEGSPVGPEGSPTGRERVTHRSTKGDPQVTPTGVTGITGEAGSALPRTRPADRCPRHSEIPPGEAVPPCHACADARRAAEEWDTRRTRIQADARSAEAHQRAEDRARAIADCTLCDNGGYRGRQLCDHDPTAADRAARGMARVRAALRQRAPQEVATDAP